MSHKLPFFSTVVPGSPHIRRSQAAPSFPEGSCSEFRTWGASSLRNISPPQMLVMLLCPLGPKYQCVYLKSYPTYVFKAGCASWVHPKLVSGVLSVCVCVCVCVCVSLELQVQHMEVPRLRVESELQLPATATATATPDPSHLCDLHHSSRQRQILHPLSEARDRIRILMDT